MAPLLKNKVEIKIFILLNLTFKNQNNKFYYLRGIHIRKQFFILIICLIFLLSMFFDTDLLKLC